MAQVPSDLGGPTISQTTATTGRRASIFGERTWADVRVAVTQRLRRRFPAASKHDIEDAVGYALVDLLDYWIHLDNSIDPDNPGKTFWYAVRRAVWRGGEHLADGLHVTYSLESLENIPGHDAPDEEVIEEMVEGNFEREEAIRLVHELDDGRADWLKGYLNGLSERQEAMATGVPRDTIHSRRRSAFKVLRGMAEHAGLL